MKGITTLLIILLLAESSSSGTGGCDSASVRFTSLANQELVECQVSQDLEESSASCVREENTHVRCFEFEGVFLQSAVSQ